MDLDDFIDALHTSYAKHAVVDYDAILAVAWNHWINGRLDGVRASRTIAMMAPEYNTLDMIRACERLRVKVAFNAPSIYSIEWEKTT